MPETRYSFTPPANTALRWMTNPGRAVPAEIATVLLGELFASPGAVIAGVLNGLVLNCTALLMHRGPVFAIFILVDVVLVAARLIAVRQSVRLASKGLPTPTDLYLVTALLWCGLQGAMAFTAMRTGLFPLQLLAATTVMGLIGPICARNYPAPRYAIALVGLCDLPFVAGGGLSGEPWLLVLLLQSPLFLFGVVTIIRRFRSMAIANLMAERENRRQARHDTLTGLLNRFGLMEQLDASRTAVPSRFVLFYLDLDGFKPVNDRYGHHVGDAILQEVGRRLRANVRAIDVVARLGGDEFVIVAPALGSEEAARYAEALIRSVAGEPYRSDDVAGPLLIDLSIGSACYPDDGELGDDLHRKADAALYEAKAAGRGVHRGYRAASPQPAPAAA